MAWSKISSLALCLALWLGPATARAQQLFTGSGVNEADEVEKMYVKGMDFLAKSQSPDGSWPDEPAGTTAALTSIATLSILAHGDDPNFGPYKQTVHKAVDFVLKQMDSQTGYIGPSMYNHGFATLALAESYGAVDDPRLGKALDKAVKLIIDAQQVNNAHAWRYSPESRDADTTVSGAQMVALMAARNAGIGIPENVVQNGIKFFLSCQTPDGGIGYLSATGPNATRTAIACLVLSLAKDKDSAAYKAAFNYLKNSPDESQYPHYFKYYASQAFFQGSPEAWEKWNHDNIRALRGTQAADGSWEGQFGATYGTAFSLLSLALNYRYLPIYER